MENEPLVVLSVKEHAYPGYYSVAFDGRVLGDSRGFGSVAECDAEITRIMEKDARDAARYDRPVRYVRP